jgi:hypothetical protein
MKRAMGVVLAVLAFAVLVRADGIAYGSREDIGRAGEDVWSLGRSSETLASSYVLKEPGKIALAGRSFGVPDDRDRLVDDILYSDFAASAKTAEGRVEFNSIRHPVSGFHGTQDEHLGIVHSDPVRRAFAVAEVPEPETLLLMMAGLVALAIWKRRSVLCVDYSERTR